MFFTLFLFQIVFSLLVAFASTASVFSGPFTHLLGLDSTLNIRSAPVPVQVNYGFPKPVSALPSDSGLIADGMTFRVYNSAESTESRELYFDGTKLMTKEDKMKYVLALLSGLRRNPVY
jgi:hypothetical protein